MGKLIGDERVRTRNFYILPNSHDHCRMQAIFPGIWHSVHQIINLYHKQFNGKAKSTITKRRWGIREHKTQDSDPIVSLRELRVQP